MPLQSRKIQDPTYVSLLIFVHLFCVTIVLSSNFSPSRLQQDLVATVGPYTKTFHLDPNLVRYQLTAGEGADRLHQWVVTSSAGDTFRYPESEWAGGFGIRRWDMLAAVGNYYAASETDEIPAEIARGIVKNSLHNRDRPAAMEERFMVQCVQHLGDTLPASADPRQYDSQGIHITYEADVWLNKKGELSVLKRSPPSQVAMPLTENASERIRPTSK